MKKILFLLLSFSIFTVKAQVESDKPVIFTGQHDSLRQVQNHAFPDDLTSAVPAGAIQQNALIFGTASGSGTLTINLSPAPASYNTGQVVVFKTTSTNTGPVSLQLNNLPSHPVNDASGRALYPGALAAGQIVTVMFDGTSWKKIDHGKKNCPTGFVAVDHDYCIEMNEGPSVVSDTAVADCYSRGARLCTVAEWYNACQNTSLGLQNMTNNWEFLDDASNHNFCIVIMGGGGQGCTGLSSICLPTAATRNYRCCFSR